jgi:cytochrome c oxidase assembly protein subunit 11
VAARGPAGTAARLGAVVAFMLALSFAAVPFYDWFCRVTGYGGATNVAEAPDEADVREETVTVRFDANVAEGMPWEFRPMQRTMEVRLGETALMFYEARNPTDAPVAGTASFNVAPYSTGAYFSKIACFCFELQVLQPGERLEMPVSFYVDPAMLEDREAKGVRAITLSYTMHPSPLPAHDSVDAAQADGEAELASAQAARAPQIAEAIEN